MRHRARRELLYAVLVGIIGAIVFYVAVAR